jgi:hypothetical protein
LGRTTHRDNRDRFHISVVALNAAANVRYRGNSGRDMLRLSSSQFDPEQTIRPVGEPAIIRPYLRNSRETIMKLDGCCHCGYVTFEAEADPETTIICNCTDCQTMSGAPLRAVIITRPGTFVLLSGKPTEYRKTADSGNVRLQGFCPHCGTALYATSVGDEQKPYNVRLGSLRQRNELVPRRQIFVRSQQAWVNDLNSITKFDGPPH